MIFSVYNCQVWNKDDYARQLLIDRKDETMISINNVEQNNDQVRKTFSVTESFRMEFHRNSDLDDIQNIEKKF